VLQAVKNVNVYIRDALMQKKFLTLQEFDSFLLQLDGTEYKSHL
jgi:enolase